MLQARFSSFAQIPSATLFGTVKDTSGAVVPEALVVVANESTGLRREAKSTSTGDYVVPQLIPGRYAVSASHSGFRTTTLRGLILTVNARLEANLTLAVGTVTEQVTVSAPAVHLETGSSSLGQTVTEREASDLPLNGRNFVQLAALSAGATPLLSTRQDEGSAISGRNLGLNVSGGRGNWNSWLIDGVEVKNVWFNTPSVLPSVDAIQEFEVMRNTFSAEYGNASAVVNVVSKSGANAVHGSVFEFLRNDHLDARNFFDVKKPKFNRNQFGGSLGGPLIRDRTFFFGYYEGFRVRQGGTIIATVPDPRRLGGDFSGSSKPVVDPASGMPFPGNRVPPERFSRVAKNFLAFIPQPNNPLPARNLIVAPNTIDDSDQFGFRLDHRLSTKDRIFGRYMFSKEPKTIPGFAPLNGVLFPFSGQNFVLQESHILSPSAVNTLKAAFNRGIMAQGYELSGQNLSAQLGLSGISSRALPTFAIRGFSGLGAGTGLDQGAVVNSYQLGDTLSIVKGKHELTSGLNIQFRRYQKVSDLSANGSFSFDGRFTGEPLADFLLGLPAIATGQIGRSIANLRSNAYSFFAEDNYKATPKITINLGLRYDYQQPWGEINRKEGFFDTAFPGGRLLVGRNPADFGETVAPDLQGRFVIGEVRRGVVAPDRNNFGPRVGFAYNVLPNTVLRAGYGIFYVDPNANEQAANFQMPPFQVTRTLVGTPTTPVFLDDLFPGGAVLTGVLSPQGGLDPLARSPYVQEWNFSLQHKLRNVLVELDYSGSLGLKLDSRVNINQAAPSPPGQIAPVQPRRPFPLWGDILARRFRDRSNYHALQLRVQKTYSHGLSFLASYTYSKAMDTQSRLGATEHQDSRNLDADRGLSAFDMRHNLTLSYTYELPFGPGKALLGNASGGLGTLVSGWAINGITTFLSGIPVNPSAPQSIANVGGFTAERANCNGNWRLTHRTPEKFFNTAVFAVPPFGTFGTCGRDIVTGPRTANFDFSIFKASRLGERLTMQFRAEFFNLFNHANFDLPVADVTNPNFGRILSARSPRDIQLALKFVF